MNIKLSDILYDNNSDVTKIFEEQDKKAKVGDPMEKVSADNIVINNAFINQLQDRFPEIIARIEKDFTKVSSTWSKYYESQKEGKPNKKLLKRLIATSMQPLGVLTKADIKKLTTRSIPLPKVGAMHGNAAQVTAGKSQIEGFLNTDFKIYQDRQVIPVFLENQLGEPLSGANSSKGDFGLLFLIPAVGAAIKKENIALYQGLFLDNPSEFKEGKVNIFTNAKKVHVLPITEENVDNLATAFKSSQALLTFAKRYNTATSFKSTQLNIESNLVHTKGLGQLLEVSGDVDDPIDPYSLEKEESSEMPSDTSDWLEAEPESQSVTFDTLTFDNIGSFIGSLTPDKSSDSTSSSKGDKSSAIEETGDINKKIEFLESIMSPGEKGKIKAFEITGNIIQHTGFDESINEKIFSIETTETGDSKDVKGDYYAKTADIDYIRKVLSNISIKNNIVANKPKYLITLGNPLRGEKQTHFGLYPTEPVYIVSESETTNEFYLELVLLQSKNLASEVKTSSLEDAIKDVSLEWMKTYIDEIFVFNNDNCKEFFRLVKGDITYDPVVGDKESVEKVEDVDEDKVEDVDEDKVEGKTQKEKVQNLVKSKLPVSLELSGGSEVFNDTDAFENLLNSLEERKSIEDLDLSEISYKDDDDSSINKIYKKIIKSRKDFFLKNTDYNPSDEDLAIKNLLTNALQPTQITTFIGEVKKQFVESKLGEDFDIDEIKKKVEQAASKKDNFLRRAGNMFLNLLNRTGKANFLTKPSDMSIEKYKALTILYMLLMLDKKLALGAVSSKEESFIPGYIQGSLSGLLLNEEKSKYDLQELEQIAAITTGVTSGLALRPDILHALGLPALGFPALEESFSSNFVIPVLTVIAVTTYMNHLLSDKTDENKVVNELICYLAYPTTIQADMNKYIDSLQLSEEVTNDVEEIANEIEQHEHEQSSDVKSASSSSLPPPVQMTLITTGQLRNLEQIEKILDAQGKYEGVNIELKELRNLKMRLNMFNTVSDTSKTKVISDKTLESIEKFEYRTFKSKSKDYLKEFDFIPKGKDDEISKSFPNLKLLKCFVDISNAFLDHRTKSIRGNIPSAFTLHAVQSGFMQGDNPEPEMEFITQDFIDDKKLSNDYYYIEDLFDLGEQFDFYEQIVRAHKRIDFGRVKDELEAYRLLINDQGDNKINETIEVIDKAISELSKKSETIKAVSELHDAEKVARRNALKTMLHSMISEKNEYDRQRAQKIIDNRNKVNKAQFEKAQQVLKSKNDNNLIGGFGIGSMLSVIGGVGAAIACPAIAIPAIVGGVFGVAPTGMAGAWLASQASSEETQFMPQELQFSDYSEQEINKNLDIIEKCISELIEKALNENKYIYKKGLSFLLEDDDRHEVSLDRVKRAEEYESSTRRKKMRSADGKLYVTTKDLKASLLANGFDLYHRNKKAISQNTYDDFLDDLGAIIKYYHNIDVETNSKENVSGIVLNNLISSKDIDVDSIVEQSKTAIKSWCEENSESKPFFKEIMAELERATDTREYFNVDLVKQSQNVASQRERANKFFVTRYNKALKTVEDGPVYVDMIKDADFDFAIFAYDINKNKYFTYDSSNRRHTRDSDGFIEFAKSFIRDNAESINQIFKYSDLAEEEDSTKKNLIIKNLKDILGKDYLDSYVKEASDKDDVTTPKSGDESQPSIDDTSTPEKTREKIEKLDPASEEKSEQSTNSAETIVKKILEAKEEVDKFTVIPDVRKHHEKIKIDKIENINFENIESLEELYIQIDNILVAWSSLIRLVSGQEYDKNAKGEVYVNDQSKYRDLYLKAIKKIYRIIFKDINDILKKEANHYFEEIIPLKTSLKDIATRIEVAEQMKIPNKKFNDKVWEYSIVRVFNKDSGNLVRTGKDGTKSPSIIVANTTGKSKY